MPTYLVLVNGSVAPDAVDRLGIDREASVTEVNRQIVEHLGGELRDVYYTNGAYDVATVVDFPDQETVIRARQRVLGMGVDDVTVLDAVHSEDMSGPLTA